MPTKFSEQITTGVDSNNLGAVTVGLEIKENTKVTMQIIANTGAHTTHITDLQCSTNNSTWHNVSGGSVNQTGIVDGLTVGARYVRARVSTAEGGASTVDVYIQAK